MIPLRFRAWHKRNDKMYSVRSLQFELDDFTEDGYAWLDREVNPSDDGQIDLSLVEIMQSTGLTDKNGKEIFEGDIVKYPNNTVWVVEWHNEVASIIFTKDPNDRDAESERCCSDRGLRHKWLKDGKYMNLEIIGNIYENPELLS